MRDFKFVPKTRGKYTRFHISADMQNYYAQVTTFLRHAMYFLRPLKCAEINFRCPAEKIAYDVGSVPTKQKMKGVFIICGKISWLLLTVN